MCGLVCVINSCLNQAPDSKASAAGSYKQRGLFRDMLLASAVRGVDGTGIFQVASNNEVFTGKHAVASAYAVDMAGLKGMAEDVHNSIITVGHVRAATVGKASDDNCHPFQGFRDDGSYIIGAHNGTLYGWDYPANDFDVDSAWAMDRIASHGTKAFEEFFGAYAFIWYDTKERGKVWFIRNSDRPLHIARTKDTRSIIMASEAGMLEWLCAKHDIDIEGVYSVDNDHLMCIDTTQAALVVESVEHVPEAYSGWSRQAGWNSVQPSVTIGDSCVLPPPASSTDDWSLAKIETVNNVKESLRQARQTNNLIADIDSPPFEAGPVDPEERFIRAQDDWFNDSYIMDGDKKRAMHEGVYGLLVQYDGVDFDKYTDSVVGEIAAPVSMNKPLAYVLNCSPHEADSYTGKQRTMVVAGARKFGGETEYIVVELNEKGEEAMAV